MQNRAAGDREMIPQTMRAVGATTAEGGSAMRWRCGGEVVVVDRGSIDTEEGVACAVGHE